MFSTCLLSAQSGKNIIPVEFRTLGLGVQYEDLYFKQGEEYLELPVAIDFMSNERIEYRGPLTMPIFRKADGSDDASDKPVGQVEFPPPQEGKKNEFVLLFTRSQGGRIQPTLIRNDQTTFPPDTVRIVNTLPAAAAVLVTKSPSVIQPGESMNFPIAENLNPVEIRVGVQTQNEGKWREVSNNVFQISPEYRRTIFIVNNTPLGHNGRFPRISMLSMAEKLD